MKKALLLLTILSILLPAHVFAAWYKGVTHVHSLLSGDADTAPEMVVSWYKEHGYQFLCLTEHNRLETSEPSYYPIGIDSYLTPQRVAEIQKKFGAPWVELKNQTMRLKQFGELARLFNDKEKFVLVRGEEITSMSPLPHLSAINLQQAVAPLLKGTVEHAIEHYARTLQEQSKRLNVPIAWHINHPNYDHGLTAEELFSIRGSYGMEIYNGYYVTSPWGVGSRPPYERLWDIALSMKQQTEPGVPIYAYATDDSHEFHEWGPEKTNPGRGWIVVRANALDPNALTEAMLKGDFYASTGVTLKNIEANQKQLIVTMNQEPGVSYTVKFIGTKKGFVRTSRPVDGETGRRAERNSRIYSEDIGEVLLKTTKNPAVYTFKGDELYVRATIISNKPQQNPFQEGDKQMAWVQPVMRNP